MILIDTSILLPIFRDKSGARRDLFKRFLRGKDFVLSRFTQLEMLQGCSSEPQWLQLGDYLDSQVYVELDEDGWAYAARAYFELRKKGLTVRSIFDCCIAQIAIEKRLTLVHNDRDFEAIAKVRPLRHQRLDLQ